MQQPLGSLAAQVPYSSAAVSKSEASTTSSPLRLIKGAMHFWSSCASLQRTPVSASNLSAQACSTQAKARVFSCIMAWKPLVLEASAWGMKSWGYSPWSKGGTSHQSQASCWVRCSLPSSIVQGYGFIEAFPYDVSPTPHGDPFTGPDFLPPVRVDSSPAHLCQNPSAGVVHWVQHPFEPWLGMGLCSRGFGWHLRWGPSCAGGTALGAFAGR